VHSHTTPQDNSPLMDITILRNSTLAYFFTGEITSKLGRGDFAVNASVAYFRSVFSFSVFS
jgi:hypothetical protein